MASLLGVVYMSTMFIGVVCFQTVIPAGSKERIVFYREQARRDARREIFCCYVIG